MSNSILRSVYLEAIAEGYNSTKAVGRFDKATVNVMVGFLSAATIAFRATGDEEWAELLEECATKLNKDWKQYEELVVALHAKLSA